MVFDVALKDSADETAGVDQVGYAAVYSYERFHACLHFGRRERA